MPEQMMAAAGQSVIDHLQDHLECLAGSLPHHQAVGVQLLGLWGGVVD